MIFIYYKLQKAWFCLNHAFFCIAVFYSVQGYSQNLVPNGGFEEHHGKAVDNWIQPGGGFYHFEVAPQKSFSGSCRNGLCLWISLESEFLSVKLNEALKKDVTYDVECYLIYDESIHKFPSITNMEIGFYFTKEPVDASVKRIILATPQVVFDSEMELSWTKFNSSFKAQGGEEYLTIGKFHSPENYKKINENKVDTDEQKVDLVAIDQTIEILKFKKGTEVQDIINKYHEDYPELNKFYTLSTIYKKKEREKEFDRINKKYEKIISKMNKEVNEVKVKYDDEIRELYVQFDPKEKSKIREDLRRSRFYFDDIRVSESDIDLTVQVELNQDSVVSDIKQDSSDEFINARAGSVIILNNVYFEINKAELLPESFAELDRLAELLESNIGMEIEISGHTDNSGSPEKNNKLSLARAKAVADYLNRKGYFENRIIFIGCGSSRPIGYNYSEEGKAKNRRVECKILKK